MTIYVTIYVHCLHQYLNELENVIFLSRLLLHTHTESCVYCSISVQGQLSHLEPS